MKNIHVLPTDKSSRLVRNSNENTLKLCIQTLPLDKEIYCYPQHIYITSDEEIKEGNWCFEVHNGDSKANSPKFIDEKGNTWWLRKANANDIAGCQTTKKIILTTDQDLIKDGVQPINDEFLEWFVKNPSCEEVEVQKWSSLTECGYSYHIIIPKEELKQEILPELVNIPMMVSMDGKNWKKRNVIALSKGIYVTSNSIKTDADTDEEFRSIDYWKFAKPI